MNNLQLQLPWNFSCALKFFGHCAHISQKIKLFSEIPCGFLCAKWSSLNSLCRRIKTQVMTTHIVGIFFFLLLLLEHWVIQPISRCLNIYFTYGSLTALAFSLLYIIQIYPTESQFSFIPLYNYDTKMYTLPPNVLIKAIKWIPDAFRTASKHLKLPRQNSFYPLLPFPLSFHYDSHLCSLFSFQAEFGHCLPCYNNTWVSSGIEVTFSQA